MTNARRSGSTLSQELWKRDLGRISVKGGQSMHLHADSRRADKWERIEFRLIYGVVFLLFFCFAVLKRLLPWTWRSASPALSDRRSVIGEAKSAASASVPFAFMA